MIFVNSAPYLIHLGHKTNNRTIIVKHILKKRQWFKRENSPGDLRHLHKTTERRRNVRKLVLGEMWRGGEGGGCSMA